MKTQIKFLVIMLASLFMTLGNAFASPIDVVDVNIDKISGEYVVVVSYENQDTLSGVFAEATFTLEELSTSKVVDIKVDTANTTVVQYNLADLTDSFDDLKKGETYTLSVQADGTSVTESFLFGSEQSTDGLGLIIEKVEVNDEEVTSLDELQVMAGEALTVDLRFEALENFVPTDQD